MPPAQDLRLPVAACVILALATGAFVFCAVLALPPELHDFAFDDTYFHADIPRVWLSLTDRWATDLRANIHPLFLLLIGLPTILAAQIIGTLPAIAGMLALNAMALVSLLYFIVFSVSGRVTDTVVLVALFLATGSFLFWAVVPETFPFGATTVLVPLALMNMPDSRMKEHMFVLAGVLTIGITPTNAMATMVCALISFGPRRMFFIMVKALLIVVLLWIVQKQLFYSAEFLPDVARESRHFGIADAFPAIKRFLLDSAYPQGIALQAADSVAAPRLVLLEGSWSPGTLASWSVWIAIVGAGIVGAWRNRSDSRQLAKAAGAILLGQMCLHIIYGAKLNFLYSLHWMPLFVIVVAFGAGTRLRMLVLAACTMLALGMGPRNHLLQLDAIDRIVDSHAIDSP